MMGIVGTKVLAVNGEGIVRVAYDTVTESYSVGLRTDNGVDFKMISKELHDLLVKELGTEVEVI